MKRPLAALAAACLLLTACGGSDDTEPSADAPAGAPSAGSSAPAAVEPGGVLLASVGTPDEPEAFEIFFTDEAGAPVTELAAGTYTVRVTDPSRSHNFVLSDPSGEEVFATSVPETSTEEIEVELVAGDYGYVCSPHPSMAGGFTVT